MRVVFSHALAFMITLAVAPQAGSQAPGLATSNPSQLVRKLADPSCRVREAAQQELIRMGQAAVAAVKAGTQDLDLEVQRRSRIVLSEILRSDADIFLETFLAR